MPGFVPVAKPESRIGKTMQEDILNYPPVNIVEKNDSYDVQLAAPGLDKTDFTVKLDANILTIISEKKEVKASETEKMIRKEFSIKPFKRSFTVDEKINAAGISARYENGILLLELPKKEEVKQVAKEIVIQ